MLATTTTFWPTFERHGKGPWLLQHKSLGPSLFYLSPCGRWSPYDGVPIHSLNAMERHGYIGVEGDADETEVARLRAMIARLVPVARSAKRLYVMGVESTLPGPEYRKTIERESVEGILWELDCAIEAAREIVPGV